MGKADIDKKEGSKDKKEETKEREFQLSYIAAPKKTLNLINVPAKRDWVSKAEDLIKSDKSKSKEDNENDSTEKDCQAKLRSRTTVKRQNLAQHTAGNFLRIFSNDAYHSEDTAVRKWLM